MMAIRIPAKAVDAAGDDISPPLGALLLQLQLLATAADIEKAGGPAAAFSGPPQSVALIEAGATALSKWWSVTLAGTAAAAWAAVRGFWGTQPNSLHMVEVGAAAAVTVALVLAICSIIGADVSGRAQAMTATINSRAEVAATFVRQSREAFSPEAIVESIAVTPLPTPLHVVFVTKASADEGGWRAIAFRSADADDLSFLVVKDRATEWAKSSDLSFTGG